MKNVYYLLLFALFYSCSPNGMYYSNTDEYYENGQLRKAKLVEPIIIQSYPCKWWVHYYENGKLDQFQLSQDFEILGISFPKNSWIFLSPEGDLRQVFLSEDKRIQNYPCTGGKLKVATGFYPDGRLRFFFPREDVQVDGVMVEGGFLKGIWLHPDGSIKKAYASKDCNYKGINYKAGDMIVNDLK